MPLAMPTMPKPYVSQRLFRLSPEKRVAPRVSINVDGRLMLNDRSEHRAVTIDASLKAMALRTDARAEAGERVVGYFDTLGRLEGIVERPTHNGLVIELNTTIGKRDRLAAQLIWLANRDMLNLPDDRRHDRIVPNDPQVNVWRSAGSQEPIPGQLFDLSHSGAGIAIIGTFKPAEELIIGSTRARVVRVFDRGIAVEFRVPIPDKLFNPDIRL